MSSNTSISVSNVGKAYSLEARPARALWDQLLKRESGRSNDAFWALRGVSFDVRRGETVGIVGRNGAGKSSLLHLIAGTTEATEGTVDVKGVVSPLLELGAGFNLEFSGRENAKLNCLIRGDNFDSLEAHVEAIREFSGLGDFFDRPARTYSSGMYARLAFSVAALTEPEILIVDEVLAVGDTAFQKKCLDKFYEIRDRGCTILFVSHDPYQIRKACQRVLLLEGGKQVAYGEPSDVLDQYERILSQSKNVIGSGATGPAHAAFGDAPASQSDESEFFVRISNVVVEAEGDGGTTHEIQSNTAMSLVFSYEISGKLPGDGLTFVVNLYRHDGLYVFGATSKMQGSATFPAGRQCRVKVTFPSLPLVNGTYHWRVAVNDADGMGIFAEAIPVCEIRVKDDFRAVGVVEIAHTWSQEGASWNA